MEESDFTVYPVSKFLFLIMEKQTGSEFLGANIDAAKEAARFGIDEDYAADYCCDSIGTQANYEAVCDAISDVRASRPLAESWKSKIDLDFKKRKK